jgi:hypothetical protein
LLRDIFRFGTATVLSYVGVAVLVLLGLRQSAQGGPPRVDRRVVPVVGVVREPGPALGAQPGTVVLAQRLERQCEHHRVPQQRLQVDQVVLQRADLELLLRIDVLVVVDEQLLEPHLDLVGDRLQAPCALTLESGSRRTRDQDALHDRLQPQVELDRRAVGDTEDLDAQTCRGLNRPRHLALGPRAATELASIEHERRSRVQLAQWFTFGSGHNRSPRIVSGQVRRAKLPGRTVI